MADDRKSGSTQENRAANNNKGGRRYFWRKKRGQKSASEESGPKEQPAAQKRAAPKLANNEKADRDLRTKRRRRRPRSRQGLGTEPKVVAPIAPLEDDYVSPTSIFVYTHVVRPDQRDNYEFRADHFSKVSRRLEDFDIDLSKIFPEDKGKWATDASAEQTTTQTLPSTTWEGTEFDERDSAANDD
jgi:hypothetical protein